jgi:haloalkane dehalogenase
VADASALSASERYKKKRVRVKGREMAYVEAGLADGDPIVFLHGNPTSSYLWRNVMPHCEGLGRLIAPDLLGMGDSDKLDDSGPGRYGLFEQREYLNDLLETLGVRENVTLVVQDWGAAIGFDWARRHADAMKGVACMEGLVFPFPTWSGLPEGMADSFRALRGEAGDDMILEQNLWIEEALPAMVLRSLGDAEMSVYRRPFREPGESRRPILSLVREVVIEGDPADVASVFEENLAWLATSPLPKLFVKGEPGVIRADARERIRSWPKLTEVTVPGLQYIQEDSPDEIGLAIAEWYKAL